MIPKGLRFYIFEGTDPTTADIEAWSDYYTSAGDRTGTTGGRHNSSAATINNSRVVKNIGPIVGKFDPEWNAWLAGENG
jgi:hypothetical protein